MTPVVLVTRKLPDAVEERLRRDYDPILNPQDTLYSSDEIIERAKGAAAILPCHTEQFTAEVIARLPESVRVIANYSVGYDHVDTEAAKARGLIVTKGSYCNEYTRSVVRRHGGTDHDADIGRSPACQRG